MSTEGSQALRLVHELVEAFNAGNWARFRAGLADDISYEETGTGRRIQGADAYVQLCQGWKAGFPDASGTVRHAIASGDTVLLEVVWERSHTGPLVGPGGTIPASGKRIRTPAAFVATVRAEKVCEARHYLDLMALLQQIGALPTPGQSG